MESLATIRERDVVDAVFDLAAVAVVLPFHARRVAAALGRAGLVDHTDRLGVGVLAGDKLLAAIAEQFLIPGDGFEKPLQSPHRDALREGHRLDILPLHVAEQPADINR